MLSKFLSHTRLMFIVSQWVVFCPCLDAFIADSLESLISYSHTSYTISLRVLPPPKEPVLLAPRHLLYLTQTNKNVWSGYCRKRALCNEAMEIRTSLVKIKSRNIIRATFLYTVIARVGKSGSFFQKKKKKVTMVIRRVFFQC